MACNRKGSVGRGRRRRSENMHSSDRENNIGERY